MTTIPNLGVAQHFHGCCEYFIVDLLMDYNNFENIKLEQFKF